MWLLEGAEIRTWKERGDDLWENVRTKAVDCNKGDRNE
jgi:hypothetical protein